MSQPSAKRVPGIIVRLRRTALWEAIQRYRRRRICPTCE